MDQTCHDSPIGTLELCANEDGICSIRFKDASPSPNDKARKSSNKHIAQLQQELDEYFAGKRRSFESKLAPAGTPFQSAVWKELLNIPFGETVSYGTIATRINNPKASRAVGGANNKNPLPIVIPCHRVVGANHTLVGYAGGIDRKQRLLELEKTALLCK